MGGSRMSVDFHPLCFSLASRPKRKRKSFMVFLGWNKQAFTFSSLVLTFSHYCLIAEPWGNKWRTFDGGNKKDCLKSGACCQWGYKAFCFVELFKKNSCCCMALRHYCVFSMRILQQLLCVNLRKVWKHSRRKHFNSLNHKIPTSLTFTPWKETTKYFLCRLDVLKGNNLMPWGIYDELWSTRTRNHTIYCEKCCWRENSVDNNFSA